MIVKIYQLVYNNIKIVQIALIILYLYQIIIQNHRLLTYLIINKIIQNQIQFFTKAIIDF